MSEVPKIIEDFLKRKLAFSIATKSCGVLGVNITAEKIWSLVEAIQPMLASGLTQRAPDSAIPCAKCGHPKNAHWHRDCGEGVYEFANCSGIEDNPCDCKKYSSVKPPSQ